MSRALYRVYRSKSLDEVVGQDHITKTLALALKNGRINHAYLFTGPRGVGKTSVARILAHAVNQLPYAEDTQHLDIIEIDAASNRRIDDIRDLREKVHIAPVSASYKVYIIDEVHMLTGESFNALLKTLEEPPAHAIFILATTEVHKLPATIISRAQRFHFRPVGRDAVVKHLRSIADAEKIKVDDAALRLIAERGEGSFRDSISLLDQLASMSGGAIDAAFVEQVLGLAPTASVEALLAAVKKGDADRTYGLLQELEAEGVSPAVLSEQLIASIMSDAVQGAALAPLVDELLEVPKSLQPRIKLSVVLLKFIGASTGGSPEAPKRSSRPKAARAGSSLELKKATPQQIRHPEAPVPAPPEDGAQEGGEPFTVDKWPDVLNAIQKTNPPVYSVLKKAAADMDGDVLRLTFGFKLHQKKLEDPKYKTKLTAAIAGLGFRCPAIETAFGKVEAPAFAEALEPPSGQLDETAASVLAMMGEGESANA